MANESSAYGLRPIGLVGAGANSTGVTSYEIASNNTNAIYQYSICVPTAAGTIDQAGATSGGTTAALGVLMGVYYQDATQKKPVWLNYWPGSGADSDHPIKAFVADDPNQLFLIASDASLTNEATARAGVFLNADLSSGTSGSTVTGKSSGALAVSTLATTAGLMLRFMGWADDAANADFSAAGIPCIVRFTSHFNADSLGIVVGTPATTGV